MAETEICYRKFNGEVPSKSTPMGSAGGRPGQREELNGDAGTTRPQLTSLFHGELVSGLSELSQIEAWGLACTPRPI